MTISILSNSIVAIDSNTIPGSYDNVVLNGCVSEDGNTLYTIHSVGSGSNSIAYGRVFKWSIDPSVGLTLIGSSNVFYGTSPRLGEDFRHITLLNSASAFILSGKKLQPETLFTSGWNCFELASSYVTNGVNSNLEISGSYGYPITTQYYGMQQVAKLSSGIALTTSASYSDGYPAFNFGDRGGLSHYGPIVFKVNFNSGRTVSSHMLDLHPYEYVTCMINIGSTVLAGTSLGNIIELNSSLNIIKRFNVIPTKIPIFDGETYVYNSVTYNKTWFNGNLEHHISSLAYHNGIIAATTSEGMLAFVDWQAPKVLSVKPYFQGGYRAEPRSLYSALPQHIKCGPALSHASSGVCLGVLTTASRGVYGSGVSSYVFEIDLTSQKVESYAQLPAEVNYPAVYTGVSNSIGWSFHNYNGITRLITYRVSPKFYRSDKVHAIIEGGQYKTGRKIIIVDDGVSASKIDGDFTVGTEPRTYSVATGKRIIEISLYGSGVTGRKGEVSIYNT